MIDIFSFIENSINFLISHSSGGFLALFSFFWFFFIFDFPRYVVLNFIGILSWKIKKFGTSKKYQKAREQLFLQNPLITVISAGRNESKTIPYLINSLEKQTYKNIEIIIVDDGSDDQTMSICKELLNADKINKYLYNEIRGGKSSALNLGLYYAKGKFIIAVDADTLFLDTDAVEKITIPFFIDNKIGSVSADIHIINANKTLWTSIQALEYALLIMSGRITTSFANILGIVSGAFGAFKKEAIEKVGGWDPGPGEDADITVKIRKLGYKIYMEPDAIAFTEAPSDLIKLTKQRLRWDSTLIKRLKKHRNIFSVIDNFSFSNFFSFIEQVIFTILLDIIFFVYLFYIFLVFPYLIGWYILFLTYLIYVITTLFQFIMVLWISKYKKKDIKLGLYIPLMPIYFGYYRRIMRTYAYVRELLFKKSYDLPFIPKKISRRTKEMGI
jgi:cellulose synthase/poly-beta-1,6-N-acetylglucosamine synthase-like glycosyltransferase